MSLPDSYDLMEQVIANASDDTAEQPSYTYYVDPDTNQILRMCDGFEAVKQAFNLLINTQRFRHQGFTSDYGMDWSDLIGQPADYIISEVQARLKEAIKPDARFISVDLDANTPYTIEGDMIIMNFEVVTVFGGFSVSTEVKQ